MQKSEKNAKKLQASFPHLQAENAITVTINLLGRGFPGRLSEVLL